MISTTSRTFSYVIAEPDEKSGTFSDLLLDWAEGEPDDVYLHESVPGFGIFRKGPIYNAGGGRNYSFTILLQRPNDDDDEEFDDRIEDWRNAKTSVGTISFDAAGITRTLTDMECTAVEITNRKNRSARVVMRFLRGGLG